LQLDCTQLKTDHVYSDDLVQKMQSALHRRRKVMILQIPVLTPSSTRLWLSIQFIQTVKRSGESTNLSRVPTPTMKGCDLTPPTRKQTSEQEYDDLTASNRRSSTLYFFSTPTALLERPDFSSSTKQA